MKTMKQKAILTLLVCLSTSFVSAYDFKIGGIYYTIINYSPNYVEVTNESQFAKTYEGDIVIPQTVNYSGEEYIIKRIGDYAFYGCNIKSIIIPEGVTSIGKDAIAGCRQLNNIVVPEGVTMIKENAFHSCLNCQSLSLPSTLISIGKRAFGDCWALTSIIIPASVEEIGELVFDGSERLTSIVVEEGNPVYDSREGCNAIIETAKNTLVAGCKKTVIPNTVTAIGNHAFERMGVNTDMIIPNSVEKIGDYAFSMNTGFIEITIPESVTSIGHYAFNIPGLQKFTSLITVPFDVPNDCWVNNSWDGSSLDYFNEEAILYVPKGTKQLYKKRSGWGVFKMIRELDENGNVTEISQPTVMDTKESPIYNLNGQRLSKAVKGINIIGGKKVVMK